MTAAPPRPGTPIARPAPMAPRTPAGPPAMDFGERIRQQREAAERMAEQRIAEAKERAAQERTAASPSFLSTGPQNAQKPRFTFADEELKQAQQDTVAQAAVGGRQSRPIFTAERPQRAAETAHRPATAAPRPSGPAPAHLQPRPATAPTANRPQPSFNPAHHPRPNEPQWQRPAQTPSPRDGIRRELPPGAQAADRPYGEPQAFRGQPRRPEGRDRNDYRGAHARELAYVEEESEDLFEEDRAAAPRRRAAAQDYAQAYQEYDGADETEEPRRRLGPFLLLGALLVVAAIAGGLIYMYQRSGGLEAGTGPVPVVAVPEQPAKSAPESGQVTDETLAPESDDGEAATPDPSTQLPAQKKQIYDRILGDTTQDETNQLAPGEEQPIVPNPTGDTEVEPIPLPLPPQPGGSSGQSGAVDQPAPQVTAGVAQPAAATAETSSVASVESVTESESSDPTATPTAASTSTTAPSTEGVTQVSESAALNVTSEPPPVEQAPQPEIVADTATPTTTPAPPPPPQEIAAAEAATDSGAGPISITPGAAPDAPAASAVGTPTTFLPDVAATQTPSASRRTGTRAGDRFVSTANTNFNRANQGQQQVAIIEPEVLTSTIAPAEPPTAPQTAAALPTPDPIEPSAPSASAGAAASGYVLQLASYKSEAEARADFDRLRQRHGSIIGGLAPEIQKTDLAGVGTFYRLSLGPVASRQTARAICGSLLAAGERDCLAKAR